MTTNLSTSVYLHSLIACNIQINTPEVEPQSGLNWPEKVVPLTAVCSFSFSLLFYLQLNLSPKNLIFPNSYSLSCQFRFPCHVILCWLIQNKKTATESKNWGNQRPWHPIRSSMALHKYTARGEVLGMSHLTTTASYVSCLRSIIYLKVITSISGSCMHQLK